MFQVYNLWSEKSYQFRMVIFRHQKRFQYDKFITADSSVPWSSVNIHIKIILNFLVTKLTLNDTQKGVS